MSIKITATAYGRRTPTTSSTGPVTNGDFLINLNPGGITGDGLDEQTNWTFNFAGDPHFPLFSPLRQLTSVLLTLTLTPKGGQVDTDGITIYQTPTQGLGSIGGSTPDAPEIQNLPVGVTSTIQMELLNRIPEFSSAKILGVFSAQNGKISMHYADDAIVSFAKLELIQECAVQYAVKIVCGKSDGKVVAPGVYFTAVNVHNPTYETIKFRVKVAVALPGLQPGPVSQFYDAKLGPDEALEIDREDIHRFAGTKNFVKGFVVIESDVELDVVAVYTASGLKGSVTTLHTERVSPRCSELGLPDLIPVPDADGSFCRRKDGTLTVTVKNQGTSGAGPSVTEVDFFAFGKVAMPTPPLGPGVSVDILVPIPSGCFDPNCEFRITVDANNQVNESDEGNNIAKGICLG